MGVMVLPRQWRPQWRSRLFQPDWALTSKSSECLSNRSAPPSSRWARPSLSTLKDRQNTWPIRSRDDEANRSHWAGYASHQNARPCLIAHDILHVILQPHHEHLRKARNQMDECWEKQTESETNWKWKTKQSHAVSSGKVSRSCCFFTAWQACLHKWEQMAWMRLYTLYIHVHLHEICIL